VKVKAQWEPARKVTLKRKSFRPYRRVKDDSYTPGVVFVIFRRRDGKQASASGVWTLGGYEEPWLRRIFLNGLRKSLKVSPKEAKIKSHHFLSDKGGFFKVIEGELMRLPPPPRHRR
jgi:hypothetical protein